MQYDKNAKISVEYKPREPRAHQLSGTLGITLFTSFSKSKDYNR